MNQRLTLRTLAVGALLIGAAGIAILWAGGVDFPVVVPPGIVILGLGTVAVALVHRPWSALLATALGAFVFLGFLLSPTGISNLTGDEGAVVAIGQGVQVLGVCAAAVLGVLAYRSERAVDREAGARPVPT